MKADHAFMKSSKSSYLVDANLVKEFAEQFVQNIIDEAIKQSSQTAWLIHCSEHCHKLNDVQWRQQKAFLCWTPECNQNKRERKTEDSDDYVADEKDDSKCSSSCSSSFETSHKREEQCNSNYVFSVEDDNTAYNAISEERSKNYRTLSNCNKCLKPKAIHAFNLLKSTQQKTFSDFKLFLLNLYSSNDISVQKISSEHSAFTAYCRRNNITEKSSRNDICSNTPNDVSTYERNCYEQIEKSLRHRKTEENVKLMRIKNEKDKIKPIRKCNRIKRCNFFSLKHSFCNVFKSQETENKRAECMKNTDYDSYLFRDRSLPPLPRQTVYTTFSSDEKKLQSCDDMTHLCHEQDYERNFQRKRQVNEDYLANSCDINGKKLVDFAYNIEKVKDYGWYWGPMSSEAAEKLLLNEPDGSFIVRDSSDDRYIFSLTFKLNACIRHVRIEHGHGNFSFGNDTNFKSDTIVDFIENAVQHSRSGRYLFFIHRRPVHGPMRVLLLYPVSRFKGHVPSLQHMCRFVILKTVRRDLIPSLPLPKPVLEYLSSKDYYTEQSF